MGEDRRKARKVSTIDVLARLIQEEFVGVSEKFEDVNKQFGGIHAEFSRVHERMDRFGERLGNVEKDVKWMKDNAGELFAKLDRFIALLEKQEQETAVLAAHVKRLEERVAKLESLKK